MPIYEYQCEKCGKVEVIQAASESPLRECPECAAKGKKSKVSRLVSPAAFHLKGSGWYKTDYTAGKSQNGAKPDNSTGGETAPKSEKTDSGSKEEGKKNSKVETKTPGGGCGSSSCGCG